MDISTAASTYSVKAGSNSITTVGNLVNGSIGGSMIINTTGNITGNNITGQKLEVSGIVISGNKIGNSSTPNLISISDGNVNVSGTFNTSSLKIGTNLVNSSAADLNKLHNIDTTKEQLTYLSDVTSNIQAQIDNKLDTTDASTIYAPTTGHLSIATVGTLTEGSINGALFGNIDITSNINSFR